MSNVTYTFHSCDTQVLSNVTQSMDTCTVKLKSGNALPTHKHSHTMHMLPNTSSGALPTFVQLHGAASSCLVLAQILESCPKHYQLWAFIF